MFPIRLKERKGKERNERKERKEEGTGRKANERKGKEEIKLIKPLIRSQFLGLKIQRSLSAAMTRKQQRTAEPWDKKGWHN